MAIISYASHGMPAGLITEVSPALALSHWAIWQDDLSPQFSRLSNEQAGTVGGDIGGASSVITVSDDFLSVQTFWLDMPLVQTVTNAPDASQSIVETDADSFGCLEMGGEFEGVLARSIIETEDPWSIPRYSMTGQTLDCDTSAPIAAATIRQFRSIDNRFVQQTISDGSGNYAIPVFDQEEYFLIAHQGHSPAGVTRRDLKGV